MFILGKDGEPAEFSEYEGYEKALAEFALEKLELSGLFDEPIDVKILPFEAFTMRKSTTRTITKRIL
ncbi:MAG: hypothetical protein JJE29_05470 [Peptostreptococcaceae bacterium]|nr:hypothetical protein [Peptostreptococcaceae bacterium]